MNNYQLFKALHYSNDGFVLGNVHDVLSAVILEAAGFKALGTTSWGVANSFGYRDGQRIFFHDYLFVIQKILAQIKIPLSVDIEAGFAEDFDKIIENILRIADLGVVGINIEDSLKNSSGNLMVIERQGELIARIRESLDQKGYSEFFINARTDTYLQSNANQRVENTIKRGQCYAKNGADGFFVPCLVDKEEISIVIREVPLPLNLMSLPNLTDFRQLQKLKVKRFSFGNALSDFVIASIEKQARQVIQLQSTELLFQHAAITTQFDPK